MRPLILHHYYGVMDGVFASVSDLYYNLSQYIDVDFNIMTLKPEECIKHLFKNNSGDLVNKITVEDKIERDIIICSARFLYDEVCRIKCKRLFVLDSLDLSKSLYGVQPSIYFYVPPELTPENIIFLSNESNIISECLYSQMVYYQKLSKQRLDKLPVHYGRIYENYNLKNHFFQDVYDFRRSDKEYTEVRRGKYFENVGRLIFEHLYFDKEVNYHLDGMFMKDGLYYYLELFGINGMIPHCPLPITKKMIEDTLFMKENDPFLDLLRNSLDVLS